MRSDILTFFTGFALTMLHAVSAGTTVLAGGTGGSEWLQIARPLDIPAERLERPRPEQDRSLRSVLSQAEVLKLAKAEARKQFGKRFDEYEAKAVIFEPSTGLWSVTFEQAPPHRSPEGCIVVFVRDTDKTTELQHCT